MKLRSLGLGDLLGDLLLDLEKGPCLCPHPLRGHPVHLAQTGVSPAAPQHQGFWSLLEYPL